MPTYTKQQLREEGPPFAMAMLLRVLKVGEAFVTYDAIREELQYQLGIKRIFPTDIGIVAGSLMNQILEIDPDAPLINAMITRANGIPGSGIGPYFRRRYRKKRYADWDNLPKSEKIDLVSREREKVLEYPDWQELNDQLYGRWAWDELREKSGTEQDGKQPGGGSGGGPAESAQHKKLKEWVAFDCSRIGLRKAFGRGTVEAPLQSGDTMDVLFESGAEFVTVEVKSCLSNDEDFRRGIYQCIKYREVKEAEHSPSRVRVKALLVTERVLRPDLQERARLLGIKTKVVKVN